MSQNAGYIGYQLRELYKGKLLGTIFTDPDNPDDYIAGYVCEYSPKSVLIKAVTHFGKWDGFFAVRQSAVFDAIYDAIYAARLELILKLNGEPPVKLPLTAGDDIIRNVLEFAAQSGRVITLWTATETYVGFVSSINDMYLKLIPVDFMGERCQDMQFRLPDIEMVSICSEEEIMYEMLDSYYRKKN